MRPCNLKTVEVIELSTVWFRAETETSWVGLTDWSDRKKNGRKNGQTSTFFTFFCSKFSLFGHFFVKNSYFSSFFRFS